MRKLGGRFTAGFAKGKREQPQNNNSQLEQQYGYHEDAVAESGAEGEDEDGYGFTALATVRPASRVLSSVNGSAGTGVQAASTFPSDSSGSSTSIAAETSMSSRSRSQSRQLPTATAAQTSRRYDSAQLVSAIGAARPLLHACQSDEDVRSSGQCRITTPTAASQRYSLAQRRRVDLLRP